MLSATAEIEPELPDRITVTTPYRCKESVKAVPGCKWIEGDKWSVPLTWPACLALRTEYGAGLTIGHELRAWAKEISGVKAYLAMHRTALTPKEMGVELGDDVMGLPGFADLYPPQLVDALLINAAKCYLLMNETGSGKGRSALAGLSLRQAEQGDDAVFPLMIVAPKSMTITWQREVERLFPDREIALAVGTPTKIRKALTHPTADVFIIGWESIRKYSKLASFGSIALTKEEKIPKEIQDLAPKSIIFDECHRSCNPQSQRTRAAWAVATSGFECNRIGLTGSPMEESIEDLYGILHLVFPDEYPTKTSYIDRYAEVGYGVWGERQILGLHPAREEEFRKNFSAISRRLTKAVMHPFLPDKIREVRWVTLPPKYRKAYNEMRDTMLTALESGHLVSENALVKAGRLIQMANAHGDVDEEGNFVMLGSTKMEAFMDDVLEGDYDGEQVVVFSDSRKMIELLAEEMTAKKEEFVMITGSVTGDDRQAAMDRFQAGEVPFCLLTRAGGEGITLTAASTMVRLVRPWSFRTFVQVEDRVHRIGSEVHERIRYVDYITEDTLELGQMARLRSKGASAEEVLRDDELLKLLREPINPADLL